MPKQFITNGPARNVDTTPEQLGEMIAQVVLPAVAEMIDEKLKAAGIKPQAASVANSFTPPGDDDFDTLPDGDTPKPGSNGRKMPPPAGDDFELPD